MQPDCYEGIKRRFGSTGPALESLLNNFSRMMALFDEKKVSFVSVTQQFNTTNSMGRLTLNMLLSFAQFEREVAGERIRDKIAATKKQGYWVCGQPPLGYRLQRDSEPRGLYIVHEEASLVQEIFDRFIATRSLIGVATELNEAGRTTRRWTSSTGRQHGGKPLSQKFIYNALTNPVYIGKVTHTRDGTTLVYDGRHDPIIEQSKWERVQSLIESRDRGSLHRWSHPHLLKGKLRTADGFAISPTSTHRPLTKRGTTTKGRGQKRIVRYYVSQKAIKHGFKTCSIKSINAEHLDDLVRGLVLDQLDCPPLNVQPAEVRDHWIRTVIQQVTLSESRLTIDLDTTQVDALRKREFVTASEDSPSRATCPRRPDVEDRGPSIRLSLDIRIKKLDGRRLLLSPEGEDLVLPSVPEPKQHLVDAIGLGYRWHEELLASGEHIKPFAASRGIARTRILQVLPLVNLGPEVLRHVLGGKLAPSITLDDLVEAAGYLDWERQAQSLGLSKRTIA